MTPAILPIPSKLGNHSIITDNRCWVVVGLVVVVVVHFNITDPFKAWKPFNNNR